MLFPDCQYEELVHSLNFARLFYLFTMHFRPRLTSSYIKLQITNLYMQFYMTFFVIILYEFKKIVFALTEMETKAC